MFWQSDKLVRKEQVRSEVRTQNTISKNDTVLKSGFVRFIFLNTGRNLTVLISGFIRLSMSSFDKSEQQVESSILQ